jgi:hypothetical protein
MTRALVAVALLLVATAVFHPRLTPASSSAMHHDAASAPAALLPASFDTSPVASNTASPSASAIPAPSAAPAQSAISIDTASLQADQRELTTPFKTFHGRDGFWRLAQDQNGVWWFVSPTGGREFLNTVTTVQPEQLGTGRNESYFKSTDWNGKTDPASMQAWASATLKRVQAAGFKGLGAWCNPAFSKLDVPMSRDLNLWTFMNGADARLYHPDWAKIAEHAVAIQVDSLRDNKSLVGYFIDNELDWGVDSVGPSVYFDHLAPNDPNRLQVRNVIETEWPTVADFNRDWKTNLTSFAQIDDWATLPEEPASSVSRLQSAWLLHLAKDYFRITTSLIRQHDPNHLILGVRFKGYAPREVIEASKGYTDALSLNYYVADAKLDMDMFHMMNDLSGQPIIISEYSFHSLDGHSGDQDTVGFSAQVPDQQARADGYRLFTTRLARVPFIIGADWFQWSDEPASGRATDGEDVNFGVVDVSDHPYPLLLSAIQQTGPLLDPLHAHSDADPQADVWRDTFATKPVMHVPFLSTPPSLDSNIGQWEAAMEVPGVRHGQAVGAERSPLKLPQVYLGWTKQGLYVGMHVYDNDLVGAPASGWWWTKDFAEVFISTRPVASDQNSYDVNCSQFFFVPDEANKTGEIGQWHREGDALKDNLIPQPLIKHSVEYVTGGYVVEMFIPAAALHGYDPANQPALAFNVHVHNFQHALDYFWSAPKEVMTQLRPSTWGTLYLDRPNEQTASARQ